MKFNFKTICFILALRKIDMPMSTFARSNVQKVPKTQKTDDGCDGRDELRHIPNVVEQVLNSLWQIHAKYSSEIGYQPCQGEAGCARWDELGSRTGATQVMRCGHMTREIVSPWLTQRSKIRGSNLGKIRDNAVEFYSERFLRSKREENLWDNISFKVV